MSRPTPRRSPPAEIPPALEVNRIHSASMADSVGLMHLYQAYLERRVCASAITWVGTYRGKFGRNWWQSEMLEDWKIVASIFPYRSTRSPQQERDAYLASARQDGLDPQAVLTIRDAGATRVRRIGDAMSAEEWDQHWWRKRLRQQGVGERMVGTYSLGPNAESHLLVDRPLDAAPFSDEDAARLYQDLTDFPRLHYSLMLERGLAPPATRPFSPREQQVVRRLLGPLSEKEIASDLGISKGSTHNYITGIYKALQVGSRYELIQLWIREAPAVVPPTESGGDSPLLRETEST